MKYIFVFSTLLISLNSIAVETEAALSAKLKILQEQLKSAGEAEAKRLLPLAEALLRDGEGSKIETERQLKAAILNYEKTFSFITRLNPLDTESNECVSKTIDPLKVAEERNRALLKDLNEFVKIVKIRAGATTVENFYETSQKPGSKAYWEAGPAYSGSRVYWFKGDGTGSKKYWETEKGVGSKYYWENGSGPGSRAYWNGSELKSGSRRRANLHPNLSQITLLEYDDFPFQMGFGPLCMGLKEDKRKDVPSVCKEIFP